MLKIPQNIKKVINILESKGFEAYVVGGAVRDALLLKTPFDFDITTSCPPEKIVSLFEKTIPTGIKHGTVSVIIEDEQIEVTTYRIDGKYTDNRSPENVTFTKNLADDLSRRDFTINALAFNDNSGLIDLFNGESHLKQRLIKTVGNPIERFSEDALRILRAIRFACQLEFQLESETYSAAVSLSENLNDISGERIFTELSKTLLSDNHTVLEKFINDGGLKSIGISKAKSLKRIKLLPHSLEIRWFAFVSLTVADFSNISSRLKFSNEMVYKIEKLILLSNANPEFDRITLKKLLNLSSPEILTSYLQYLKAINDFQIKETLELLNSILISKEPYLISHLKINGNDLMLLGYKGKIIGEILSYLLEECILCPQNNNKERLIELSKNYVSN